MLASSVLPQPVAFDRHYLPGSDQQLAELVSDFLRQPLQQRHLLTIQPFPLSKDPKALLEQSFRRVLEGLYQLHSQVPLDLQSLQL